jgi:hypothetical protein
MNFKNHRPDINSDSGNFKNQRTDNNGIDPGVERTRELTTLTLADEF